MNPLDRLALSDLVHRYAAGVDDRRFADVAALFADDATLTTPDPPRTLEPVVVHRGRTEIERAIASVAQTDRTVHAIGGEIYSTATQYMRGRITCIAHHFTSSDGKATDIVWFLRYDDEYVCTDARWRFKSRALTIDAIERQPVPRLRGT
ncbi:MAG: nuclear transport factor 2 family protein [Candidatus Sericytochromatia bacterium]